MSILLIRHSSDVPSVCRACMASPRFATVSLVLINQIKPVYSELDPAFGAETLILHISVTLPPMPSHPPRLSPPRRASSSSAAHHPQSMAYPFPRFSSAPQTPQYLKSVESPNSWQSRGFDKPRSYPTRWLLLLLAAAVVFIFLLARSFAAHPWQTDGIPFSKSDMDE